MPSRTILPMLPPMLMLMLSTLSCAPGGEAADTASRGGPAEGPYDNATESPLLALIDGAAETIDVEIYEMRDPTVRGALARAARRGVAVRVVIEPKPVGVSCDVTARDEAPDEACRERRDALRDLALEGIEIRPFSKELCGIERQSCFQHGKLLVADGKTALLSTGNFNSSSLCTDEARPSKCNRDYSVVTRDRSMVRALSRVFERDFDGKRYALNQELSAAIRRRVTVSPVAKPEMLDFIRSAERKIAVQAQYMKEPTVNRALIEAAERGVQVSITLASLCSFTRNLDASVQESARQLYGPMIDAGVDLKFFTRLNRIKGRPGYMHAKLILIDDQKAWVGSINGSSTSFKGNREFGAFTESPAAVAKLGGLFEQDHASDVNEGLEDNLLCAKESGGSAPTDVTEQEDAA